MLYSNEIVINGQVVDIAKIEAQAHKLRAEAMAEFGKNFRNWVKNLFVGHSLHTAH